MATAIEYGLISAVISVSAIGVIGPITRRDNLGRIVSHYDPITSEYVDDRGIRSYRTTDPHAGGRTAAR